MDEIIRFFKNDNGYVKMKRHSETSTSNRYLIHPNPDKPELKNGFTTPVGTGYHTVRQAMSPSALASTPRRFAP